MGEPSLYNWTNDSKDNWPCGTVTRQRGMNIMKTAACDEQHNYLCHTCKYDM